MNWKIKAAAIGGFLVPLFWGVAAFILFNAPESAWTSAFWSLVYLTCPFWILPGTAGMILMPIFNAGLYALIAAGVIELRLRKPGEGSKDI